MKADPIVIDTNVLISAALSPHSLPAKLVRLALEKCRLVFSSDTFAELETRLWRPKFDRYLSPEIRRQLLHDFSAVADWVTLAPDLPAYCRDANDDKFIHTAQASHAHWLVSGDQYLLVLSPIDDLPVLTPADALTALLERKD